jgi:hypothetical protein
MAHSEIQKNRPVPIQYKHPDMKNPHAVALGRKGGSRNTPAQQAARARNSKLGGWPKGRKRKAIKAIKAKK